MGSYFDYRDWDLQEICDSIREKIAESKKPIPPKVMKHDISIVYRISGVCCVYSTYHLCGYDLPKFKTRQEAEDYLSKISWIKRTGENSWEEIPVREEPYIDENGNKINPHYEIRESDYEVYEDGEYYTLYSDEEKQKLSEALYMIEKARIYMQVYDHCCDQGSFGEGGFSDELKEEMDKFEKDFTEELPMDRNEE